jgi:2-iminobutanoate/2-iminopropanoate deaminase
MNTAVTPSSIAHPAARYSLGVSSTSNSVWLHTSGIVGTRKDGSIANDVAEQAAETWRSLRAIFEEASFSLSDLVSYTTYVVQEHDLAGVMRARDEALFGSDEVLPPASTLIIVPRLAQPQWFVEIAAIAAR